MPELEPALYEAMPEIYIHVNGVAKLLRGIKAHKATGPDAIPARLLEEAADQLAPIMTTIYRASLQQVTVPEEWKKANVVPISRTLSPSPRRETTPQVATIAMFR